MDRKLAQAWFCGKVTTNGFYPLIAQIKLTCKPHIRLTHKSYAFLLQYSCMYLYFTDTDVSLKNGHLKCKQFDLPYNLHNVSVFHTVGAVDSGKINEVFQCPPFHRQKIA